ncbi:hypothetical protein GCM10010300_58280 [Streptomyces olivaceoviridis]|nr:hypothetical protein GCM10010300_58280 [Streptomyces olivaceoviridis]
MDAGVADDQLRGVVDGLGNKPADRHDRHVCETSCVVGVLDVRRARARWPGTATSGATGNAIKDAGENSGDGVGVRRRTRWAKRNRCALTLGPGNTAVYPLRALTRTPQCTRRAAGGMRAL